LLQKTKRTYATMIDDTLRKLEAEVQDAPTLKDDRKAELLQLVATLRNEVAVLSKTDANRAQTIAGFAQASEHEATRGEPNQKLIKLSVDGLSESVAGFEKSHPKLVEVVNSICVTLSNSGI
jgi:queuine/archaeosine tRNA-ribosyltransferase